MNEIIDTIFNPVTSWLQQTISYFNDLSVPAGNPLRLEDYFGYFALLGPAWMRFITQVIALAVIYGFVYLITNSSGLYLRIKASLKWW